MDRIEKAIFSFLNKESEVFYTEFDAYMLKRFKTLSQKELDNRMRLLEAEGKVGWFNGHWHSNYPQDFYENSIKNINSFHKGFNPNAKIIKCVRCGEYVETNGSHTYVDMGNFHGNVCKPCCQIINRMEAMRSRKYYWKRMRNMGLDKLTDLEKPMKTLVSLTDIQEKILSISGGF